MSNYKHLSGASKRKKRAEIEEKTRKYPKIYNFLNINSSSSPNALSSDNAIPSTSAIVNPIDRGKYFCHFFLNLILQCS